MKLNLSKEQLLGPLQIIHSVVERRQTLPILSNVLIAVDTDNMTFTATDMEVELVASLDNANNAVGSVTLPARKLLEICRALPADANIDINIGDKQATVKSGRSRFTLTSMVATDFPSISAFDVALELAVDKSLLLALIEKTQFAMAHQDVRYYLNGLLIEFMPDMIRAVATDGHRLAMCETAHETGSSEPRQLIVPRKGVTELARMLESSEGEVTVRVGDNHLQASIGNQHLTTKLIDGRFPDYERVLPQGGDKIVNAEREILRQGFARASILSNEKFRGIRVTLESGLMKALAHNPDQEEAEEEMEIEYEGDGLEIGFNVSYLLDIFNNTKSETLVWEFSDSNSSCLIKPVDDADSKYVVMPMRL